MLGLLQIAYLFRFSLSILLSLPNVLEIMARLRLQISPPKRAPRFPRTEWVFPIRSRSSWASWWSPCQALGMQPAQLSHLRLPFCFTRPQRAIVSIDAAQLLLLLLESPGSNATRKWSQKMSNSARPETPERHSFCSEGCTSERDCNMVGNFTRSLVFRSLGFHGSLALHDSVSPCSITLAS